MKKVLVICALAIVSYTALGEEPCLTRSWNAFNNRNWTLAIQNAEDCIFNFGPQANEKQNQLETSNYVLPKNYDIAKALTSQQKDEIFNHGLLNDVCISYWICGMSYLRLNNKANAERNFKIAERLTFGLCYNSDKFLFWSPSKDATIRLAQ